MQIENAMEPENVAAPAASAIPTTSASRAQVIIINCLKLVGFGVAAYFILPSIFSAFVPGGMHLGTNKLEKAMQLGISTKADFQAFQDDGGLNNDKQDSWLGFHVTQLSALYSDAGRLSTLDITLQQNWYNSKLASTNNIENALSLQPCKGSWKNQEAGGNLESASVTCAISASSAAGTVEVLVINK